MGIPICYNCKMPTYVCEKNSLCPRGVLSKKKWELLTIEDKYGSYYVKMSDAVDAMIEFAENYHSQFATREVLIEKKQNPTIYEIFKNIHK